MLAHAQSYTLEVSGDASTAPIYVLEGSATSQFWVDGDLDVNQSLVYSMNSAASGAVSTTGELTIKREAFYGEYSWRGRDYWYYRPAWDAKFQADSTYGIASYGQLIVANFNHALVSPAGQEQLIDDTYCNSSLISSRGKMVLVSDSANGFEFVGAMRGQVQGFNQSGRRIKGFPPYFVYFNQSITGDFSSPVWGAWAASYQVEQTGRFLSGEGELIVGADDDPATQDDPVDTIPQTLSGRYSSKGGGVFSWGAAGAGTDKKVTVKITHNTQDELVEGKNQITAAGQRRKF